MNAYSKYIKRGFDLIISTGALIVLSPLLLLLVILLAIFNSGAGVIFSQPRIGYKGREFKIYKFKTMNERRGSDGKLLPDLQRLTPFGRFIRSTSLDELPQLWNIAKGDMSLIGPRPLLIQYLPLYSPEQMRRHDVRPGITGWAQVHGRNHSTWTQRFAHDVWYVDNISLKVDTQIFFKTIIDIVRRKDIDGQTTARFTMEPFNGHN